MAIREKAGKTHFRCTFVKRKKEAKKKHYAMTIALLLKSVIERLFDEFENEAFVLFLVFYFILLPSKICHISLASGGKLWVRLGHSSLYAFALCLYFRFPLTLSKRPPRSQFSNRDYAIKVSCFNYFGLEICCSFWSILKQMLIV